MFQGFCVKTDEKLVFPKFMNNKKKCNVFYFYCSKTDAVSKLKNEETRFLSKMITEGKRNGLNLSEDQERYSVPQYFP